MVRGTREWFGERLRSPHNFGNERPWQCRWGGYEVWNSHAIISLSFSAVKENRLDAVGCSSNKTPVWVWWALVCWWLCISASSVYLIDFHCLVFHTSEPQRILLQESTLNYKYFKRHLIYYPSAESVQKATRFTNLSERQRNTQKIKQRQTCS